MEKDYMAMAEYAFAHDVNIINHAHVDICGDLIAGILLSQIIYWCTPDSTGQSKLRVVKKDGIWLAKTRGDWYEEIRITPKQYDRAFKKLQEKNLVEKSIHRFNGSPTVHIRPNWETYYALVNEWKVNKAIELEASNAVNTPFFPKGKNPNSPKVKMEITERVKTITETTTENTTETTDMDYIELHANGATTPIADFPNVEEMERWHWRSESEYISYIEKKLPEYCKNIASNWKREEADIAYQLFLNVTRKYFQLYRTYNNKLHPWYKEETISECFHHLFDVWGTLNINDMLEIEEQFFEHKGLRDKSFSVFCSVKMQEWLKAELMQDFSEVMECY